MHEGKQMVYSSNFQALLRHRDQKTSVAAKRYVGHKHCAVVALNHAKRRWVTANWRK